jgi:competence protein ComEA
MRQLAIAGILFFACALAIAAQKQPPAHPVELNSATVEQLERVPGIGPKTAQAIVDLRERSGPFRRVEDLLIIKGITQAKVDKMRPYLSVTLPPQKVHQP